MLPSMGCEGRTVVLSTFTIAVPEGEMEMRLFMRASGSASHLGSRTSRFRDRRRGRSVRDGTESKTTKGKRSLDIPPIDSIDPSSEIPTVKAIRGRRPKPSLNLYPLKSRCAVQPRAAVARRELPRWDNVRESIKTYKLVPVQSW